ncbi:MAG: hypothetical protein M1825_000911 [Sarcosagium campestre]|nr:MAG: hypothetical protein M1825_000911 [Sarcosagium campestre]
MHFTHVFGTLTLLLSLIPSSTASPQPLAGPSQFYPTVRSRSSLLHRQAGNGVERALQKLERRQAPPPSAPSASSTASPEPVKLDPEQWDTQTSAACLKYLGKWDKDPSGLAVCYNLPSLDNSTGSFDADLRLYRIAPPTGDWVDVTDADVTVGVVYADAVATKSTAGDEPSDASTKSKTQKGESMPMMLQSFRYTGSLNPEMMNKPMNLTQLEASLTPNVTLSATTPKGKKVKTVLSSKEASFVSGSFQAFTAASAAEALASAGPFELPGTTLGMFPTGLVITGVWAGIGIAVVAWGTVGRFRFRDQYRRRIKRGQAAATRTI